MAWPPTVLKVGLPVGFARTSSPTIDPNEAPQYPSGRGQAKECVNSIRCYSMIYGPLAGVPLCGDLTDLMGGLGDDLREAPENETLDAQDFPTLGIPVFSASRLAIAAVCIIARVFYAYLKVLEVEECCMLKDQ